MGNTRKSKGKRCGPSNDQPMAEDSWAQVRNRPWLYYCCLRPGHQDQLLSSQDPKRWHRPNAQDLWSISGNYSPYCGRVHCDHELANTEYIHTPTKLPWSYLHWNICKEMNIDTNEKWSEHEPETVTRQHHNLVANANTNRY